MYKFYTEYRDWCDDINVGVNQQTKLKAEMQQELLQRNFSHENAKYFTKVSGKLKKVRVGNKNHER